MLTETFIIIFTITLIFWASVLFFSVLFKILYSLISSEYFKRTILLLSPLLVVKYTKKAIDSSQNSCKCDNKNYSYILQKPDVNSDEYVKINKTRSYHDYSSDEESYETSFEKKKQAVSKN